MKRPLNTTIKKKGTIEVRQTTASRLRMNKLNPLHGIVFTNKAPSENVKTPIALSKPSNSTKPKTNCPLPKTSNKLSEKKVIRKHDFISVSSKQSGLKDLNSLNVDNKTETFSQRKEPFRRRNLFQAPSSAKDVHKDKAVRRCLSVNNINSMPDNIPLEFGPKMLDHKCSSSTKGKKFLILLL